MGYKHDRVELLARRQLLDSLRSVVRDCMERGIESCIISAQVGFEFRSYERSRIDPLGLDQLGKLLQDDFGFSQIDDIPF